MTTQIELIRGKIAKIMDSRKVALNVGEQNGVETGMLFDILSRKGLGITDPDTGEDLGSIDLAKARVKIVRVYDKFSLATTYRTKRVNVGGVGVGNIGDISLASMFEPPKWETRRETLKIEESSEYSSDNLDEQDSYVAIGDVVVQVLDDDE